MIKRKENFGKYRKTEHREATFHWVLKHVFVDFWIIEVLLLALSS